MHGNPPSLEFALSVGEEIRRVRKRAKISQLELADKANSLPSFEDLGLSRQAVCLIENGDYNVTVRQFSAICLVLDWDGFEFIVDIVRRRHRY